MLTKLGNTEEQFKRWYRIIFLIAIAVSVVFLAIFGMLGLRVNSELSCGRDTIGAHSQAVYDNRSDLDNAGDYVLQEFEINLSDYIEHEFCFTAYCVPADGCRIDVINQDETVLMSEFEPQGQHSHCSMISNITDHQYLGLSCPTCTDAATELKIQEVVAGDTKNIVDNNVGSLNIIEDEMLTFTLHSYKSCKGTLKFFLWCYIWLMVGLFFLMLILVGFRRFEKLIFEEVDMTKGN